MLDKKENLLVSKMVSEITTFFLNHHIDDISVVINHKKRNVMVNVGVSLLSDELLQIINHSLDKERDTYFELYGISLLGDGSSFDSLGSLIDSYSITNTDKTVISITRNFDFYE